jgi:GTP-binding protein
MMPIVAIFGRANVGKSLLFNRLTSGKAALVVDYPGTTRDRQYKVCHLGEQPFILVDTGGVEAEPTRLNSMQALVSKHSWAAVLEAELVLFLVDAQQELNNLDFILAEQLRLSGKPVLLVANKIDGVELQGLGEYYRLGLGPIMPIAALYKRGLKALLTAITEKLQNLPSIKLSDMETELEGVKVAIVGRPNVGKSTFINTVLQAERVLVLDEPGTTRDSVFIPFQFHKQAYILIDTAGVRAKNKTMSTVEKFSVMKTLQAVAHSDVVILMLDAKQGVTVQDLDLASFIIEAGKGLVVAVNKVDLLSKMAVEKLEETVNQRFAFAEFAETHYVSAMQNYKLRGLFSAVLRAYYSAQKKVSTPLINRLLKEIIQHHLPPVMGKHRIKLRYAHIGGHQPLTIVIHGNQVEKLPLTYQKYLNKAFRRALKIVGAPIILQFKNSINPY